MNWLKMIIKITCVLGVGASFLLSLYILDHYYRKQYKTDEQEEKFDAEPLTEAFR